jgi:riboflavin kinase / FMN adenylyltransferase
LTILLEKYLFLKTHILYKEYPKIPNAVVSVGSFDGLHKGHRVVIKNLIEEAKRLNTESLVLTFEPHPRIVLHSKKEQIKLLTNKEEKQLLFEKTGLDHLLVFPFTKEFSQTNPEDFIIKVLYEKIGMRKLIIGFDHFFGNNRQGNIELIKTLATKYNFQYIIVEAVNDGSEKISSTIIRDAIITGNLSLANNYLGHPYVINGKVARGYQIGRKIGFPTANLEINNSYKLLPPNGVYVVKAYLNGVWMNGMMNFGTNPTIANSSERKMEIHVFDLKGIIYGESLTIALIKKIRNEIAFNNVEELKTQLEQDKIECLALLNEI